MSLFDKFFSKTNTVEKNNYSNLQQINEINSYKRQIDSLNKDNLNLKTKLSSYKTQIDTLKEENIALKKKATTYENQINRLKKEKSSTIRITKKTNKKKTPVAHVQNQDGIKANFINATVTKDGSLDLYPPKISGLGYTIKSTLPVVKDKTIKNPTTGNPVGSKEEITKAEFELESAKKTVKKLKAKLKDSNYGITEKYLDSRDHNKRTSAQLLVLSAVSDATANLYFIQGNWNKAEKEWLSVLYTTHKISDKLAKFYKRQHRYSDASDIIHLGNFAVDCNISFMRDATLKNRIKKYKDLEAYATQHSDKDKSKPINYQSLFNKLSSKQSQNGF